VSWDISITFAILLTTIALFIWDRIQMALVGLMAVLALCFSGVISPAQAVSGFGQSIVVMIAALFVVGEGLFRTGVAASVGSLLIKAGGESEVRLLLLLMPAVALISAFMSSTGAVALFIPIVIAIARRSNIPNARLMMPLAYASLMGGMLTLIGTPPNIVVSGQLEQAGLPGFGFFDFSPVGLIVLLVGMLYMLTVGRWFLSRLGDNKLT
jgi:di/tricarboxylate transporter